MKSLNYNEEKVTKNTEVLQFSHNWLISISPREIRVCYVNPTGFPLVGE